MAGTRWVLGALLRGCGCNCSSCRRTGAACLPFYSAAAAAAASYSALRAPLFPRSLAAAAGPARGYSQESKTTYLEDLPPLPEYELSPSKLGENKDEAGSISFAHLSETWNTKIQLIGSNCWRKDLCILVLCLHTGRFGLGL